MVVAGLIESMDEHAAMETLKEACANFARVVIHSLVFAAGQSTCDAFEECLWGWNEQPPDRLQLPQFFRRGL